MDWLMHNWVADMRGPNFLLLYAMVCAATCFVCWWMVRKGDWTDRAPETKVPTNPDPYEIAYLRGGENELIRSVVFSLTQRNYLRVDQTGGDSLIAQSSAKPEGRGLPPMEQRAYEWFYSPRKAREIFDADALAQELKPFCSTYEERLRKEHLLMPADAREAAVLIWLTGALVIAGLGSYKLMIALLKGRTNVVFLIIMGIVALLILIKVCRSPRLSRRGREYLEKLQLAFSKLKSQPLPVTERASVANAAAAIDPALLMVGLFGVGALSGTAYDYYNQTFRRAGTPSTPSGACSGAGCGSSGVDSGGDGGTDSGGASSCSGGSSCGGGGCGGGGCGGCGGS